MEREEGEGERGGEIEGVRGRERERKRERERERWRERERERGERDRERERGERERRREGELGKVRQTTGKSYCQNKNSNPQLKPLVLGSCVFSFFVVLTTHTPRLISPAPRDHPTWVYPDQWPDPSRQQSRVSDVCCD